MASLELLASPPGTGKTTHCIERFKKQILKTRSGIHSRSFFILPSREHVDRIQNLILKKDVPGVFNAHILTINDLASRLLGVLAVPHPSDTLRQAILREILQGPMDFNYFEASKELAGFHRLCSDLIKEFKSSLLSITEFERRAQPLLKSPIFRLKFKDFSVLVKNYEKRLTELGFAEPEDAIAMLADSKPKSGPLDLVVFDGFYHFSRAQNELIRALTRLSENVMITLTISTNPDDRPELFYYPRRTRSFLLSIGFREKEERFAVTHRTENPALIHLEQNLFLKTPARYGREPVGLAVLEAPDAHSEIETIAREIRRLSREEPLNLSDICVILRNVSPYQKIIASVFEKFGIPVHIHERYKLKDTALGSLLYRFLNLSTLGWKREDLFYVLKSGFYASRVPFEELLDFEAKAISRGLSEGREAWLALAGEKKASAAVKALLGELVAAEKEMLSAKDAKVFAAKIRGFIRRLKTAEPEAEKAVETILRNVAFQTAAQTVEFQALIESGLFSVKPRGKNRVQVYDVVMALPKEYKIVFVAGLLERTFPQVLNEEPLFKDEERRVLNEKGIVLEERAFRIAGERYFFYMALTRSREKVYLTYPLFDMEERPCLPSFFIEEVRKCFERDIPSRTKTLGDFLPAPEEWETEKEAMRGLAEILGGQRYGAEAKNIARAAMRDWIGRPDFKEVLKWAERDELQAAIHDPRIVKAFSETHEVFSATRLERMAACAFRYFASEILELGEPAEGREASQMGNILHKTLETYFKSLTVKARKTGSYVEDTARMKNDLKAFFEPIAEKSPLSRGKRYRFNLQLTVMKKALELFAETEKELFEKRGFTASAFELRFGYGEKSEPGFLEISSAAGTVRLRGQIDRLDVSPDGKSAVVTDYKLSQRPSVHGKLEEGLELQLPIYLLAARRLLGYDVLGAEHRYLKQGKTRGIYRDDAKKILGLRARKTYTQQEFEALLADTEERIQNLVARIRKADVTVKSKSCAFCHFSPVCRFEPWRLAYAEESK